MAKSESKTTFTDVNPRDFIASVEHPRRKADALRLLEIMQDITGEPPRMWGPSIIGFGQYHYVYESGREGDAPLAGFSPRKAQMVVYLVGGYEDRFPEELAKIGKYKPGKACLYFSKLDELDENILRYLIKESCDIVKATNS